MDNIMGYRVLENVNLTKEVVVSVPKSWIDRVLEWNPCNPWRKPDTIVEHVPDPEVYMLKGQNLMVVHPYTLARVKNELGL